jgi:hypothetical protein
LRRRKRSEAFNWIYAISPVHPAGSRSEQPDFARTTIEAAASGDDRLPLIGACTRRRLWPGMARLHALTLNDVA